MRFKNNGRHHSEAWHGTGKYIRISCVVATTLVVSGCGNSNLLEPIGIGSGRDDLKRSPCACYELLQDYGLWKRS
jgi:hypothetical protein